MPTPGEKKALFFLSLVAALGSASRLIAARGIPEPNPEELRALEAQIHAVDSVRRTGRKAKGATKRTRVRQSPDTAERGSPPAVHAVPPFRSSPSAIDVNAASATQLEALPGIGPALGRRIVAARDSSGPFGGLEDLQSRVRGVGPALARRLAPAVTFSGARSPPSAERTEPFGDGGTAARRKRRRGH